MHMEGMEIYMEGMKFIWMQRICTWRGWNSHGWHESLHRGHENSLGGHEVCIGGMDLCMEGMEFYVDGMNLYMDGMETSHGGHGNVKWRARKLCQATWDNAYEGHGGCAPMGFVHEEGNKQRCCMSLSFQTDKI